MNMEPPSRVNQPEFSEIFRQFVDQLECLFLGQLEFQSAKGQSLAFAEFFPKRPVYWTIEILGIDIEGQLLAN